MATMDNGERETIVLIPYGPKVFRKNGNGQLRTIRRYVKRWLKDNVGEHCPPVENCSEEYPWRCRTHNVNKEHAFFFRNKGHAVMFKLRFGGS